jgi:hypothetical protein
VKRGFWILAAVLGASFGARAGYNFFYRHAYELSSSVAKEKRAAILNSVESVVIRRGLTLKQKYHDLFPHDALVYEFGLPHKPGDREQEEGTLGIAAFDNGLVEFIQVGVHYSEGAKLDMVMQLKSELLRAIADEIGGKPALYLDPLDSSGLFE